MSIGSPMTAGPRRLGDLATAIRSKNAGPFELTLDVTFEDVAAYQRVRDSGVLNRETVARLYRVPEDQIYEIVAFDPAQAIKVTMLRPVPSGDVRDSDVYGAQQHGPLLDLTIP